MIVFVSFSSTNREAVEGLVVQLGELGHDVEYEVKFIGAPITWRRVFTNISNCDLFISAVTRETLLSYTCEIEYQYARSINKNILAVLLEDLNTEELPDIKVKGLVDFRVITPESRAALAQTISSLPAPVPPLTSVIPPANWVTPLADLRKRIENLSRDAREQRGVILNVKEFLERRESFEVARSLLDLLAVQKGLREQTNGEIDYIRNELITARTSTRVARRRRTIVSAIILSAVVALVAVILSQLFFRFRANYNVELSMTRTAEVIAVSDTTSSVTSESTTATAIATLVSTTAFTASPTNTQVVAAALVATRAATVALSTNTPVIPTSTPVPPTATTIPSAVPTSTRIPPTATSTLTPIPPTATFTLTPIPPTATFTPTLVPPTATSTVTLVPPSPTLGFSFMPTSTTGTDIVNVLPQSMYVGLGVEDTPLGLKINNVGSVAKAAGVQVGDYVLAVDLDNVTTRDQFLQTMQTRNPFSRVALRVRRNAGIYIITFALGLNDFAVVTPAP